MARSHSYQVVKLEANLGLTPELTVEKEVTAFQGDLTKRASERVSKVEKKETTHDRESLGNFTDVV